jgi:hypothetical protein
MPSVQGGYVRDPSKETIFEISSEFNRDLIIKFGKVTFV